MNLEIKPTGLQINTDGDDYMVIFTEDTNQLQAKLSKTQLEALGLLIVSKCPLVEPKLVFSSDLASIRHLLTKVSNLDNRSIQLWLREIASDELIQTLWLSTDETFIRKVLLNMSSRAATMLLEDLDAFASSNGSPDSDKVNQKLLKQSVESVMKAVHIYEKLQSEGSIA